jgi:hypothetical protein
LCPTVTERKKEKGKGKNKNRMLGRQDKAMTAKRRDASVVKHKNSMLEGKNVEES